jgi:hypothetical protein
MLPALALAVALSSAACNNDTTVENRADAAADEAAREADRVADLQKQRTDDVNGMQERLTSLQREYDEKTAARVQGTSGTAATRMRTTLAEDMTNVRKAVDDLRTTTADNWWDRHESALKQTIDEVEEDVKRVARVRTLPAAGKPDPALETKDGASTEPFLSRRDRFVTQMNARIDAMQQALERVKAKGARQTELEDVKARVNKLDDDLDHLKSASADDWWDLSKARVNDYIERVEQSIARLDDNATTPPRDARDSADERAPRRR